MTTMTSINYTFLKEHCAVTNDLNKLWNQFIFLTLYL